MNEDPIPEAQYFTPEQVKWLRDLVQQQVRETLSRRIVRGDEYFLYTDQHGEQMIPSYRIFSDRFWDLEKKVATLVVKSQELGFWARMWRWLTRH